MSSTFELYAHVVFVLLSKTGNKRMLAEFIIRIVMVAELGCDA